jgi:asparagine synthase (glutamine-hydrolysing)
MCGIVGIVKLDPREIVDEARLKLMRDVLRHRGPDGEGLLVDGRVGLGHRRLAIVDVAGGHQPMANEDQSVWVVYNGEIYNHGALRPELEARGHRYQTRSDTETILHAYEEDGERCVERFNGMFAFAVWDRARERILLARDRLGIKPLYYACTEDELLFASEIKAILAARSVRAAMNRAVVPEFLATRFVSGEETFFTGVKKLLPGRTLSWSPRDGIAIRRYWQLPMRIDDSRMSLHERAAEVRRRLTAAVRSHLMTDVPLGLFLSGGIDSTALAVLMAPMVGGPIQTFSVGFNDPNANELPYARLAARAIGAQHHEIVVSPEQFFGALPRLIWHEDEPIATPASVPLHFVSRLARDHVKVVLTGEGSDELFLGYHRYAATIWNERLGRVYARLAPAALRREVRRRVPALPTAIRRRAERSFLALPATPRHLFFDNFAVFSESRQHHLVADRRLLAARDIYADGLRHYAAAPGGSLEGMSHADLQTYLVELLMKQDQMSMAASIESRVPFLEHELVEYVSAMPGRFKIRGRHTKAVLRAAVESVVPREILHRPKMGFPVPLGRWLRGPFAPVIDEFVLGSRAVRRGLFVPSALRRLAEEHRAGIADHGDRLWLLVNLEIWQRMFLEGEEPGQLVDAAS